MKKIVLLMLSISCFFVQEIIANTQDSLSYRIQEAVYDEWKYAIDIPKKEQIIVKGILPLRKMEITQSFYGDLFLGSIENSSVWIAAVSVKGKYELYQYDTHKPYPWTITPLQHCPCLEKIPYIFDTNRHAYVFYFLEKEEISGFLRNNYFLATSENDSISFRDICTDEKFTLDSLILLRYGSLEKYIELRQEEEKAKLIWLETPKTIEDAYKIIKNDYSKYFSCYPTDTLTAVFMLLDEISSVANLTHIQKRLLKEKIIYTINKERSETPLPWGRWRNSIINGIFIGNHLDFYDDIKSVLTKSQMDIYLAYYEKMVIVRQRVSFGLFGIVGRFPKPVIQWDNYTKHKDKYVDSKDFLRKEVYKK
ncbi:MAG: hypothetical protein LBQ31_08095 [Bacteroidales bacterium]|jgi:hypothetical protein|nr:hypothetical protein [Bacteroidales bacterium]